jgi:uncharacterized membrane-anchored protein YhcB (DUF1043 family)
MFKQSDTNYLFPIPSVIAHWCTDNYLADRANLLKGVGFAKNSVIQHSASSSANLIHPKAYKRRIMSDIKNYQAFSGRDMSLIC